MSRSSRGQRLVRSIPILSLAVLTPSTVVASELSLGYDALARNIVLQVMTEDGRYYMQGDPSTPCRYAFIQDPRVDSVDGRLRVQLLFSGATGMSVAGRCVGKGDNFDLTVTGVPAYADGELYLDDLNVEASAAYFTVVSLLVESQMRKKLRIPLQQDLEQAAAWLGTSGRGTVAIRDLDVQSIDVEEDGLRFTYDLTTSIR